MQRPGQDSWAADAGILVGSELLELNGQEAHLVLTTSDTSQCSLQTHFGQLVSPGPVPAPVKWHFAVPRGQMSAEDFRAALKQRPLRVKLAPPMAEAWHPRCIRQSEVAETCRCHWLPC